MSFSFPSVDLRVVLRATSVALCFGFSACTLAPPPPMTSLPELSDKPAFDAEAPSPAPAPTPVAVPTAVPSPSLTLDERVAQLPADLAKIIADLKIALEKTVTSSDPAKEIRAAVEAAGRAVTAASPALPLFARLIQETVANFIEEHPALARNNSVATVASSGASQGAFGGSSPGVSPVVGNQTVTSNQMATTPTSTNSGQSWGFGGPGAMTTEELAAKFKRKPPPEYVMVEVLYATDRKPIAGLSLAQWRLDLRDKGSTVAYYGDDHGELQYGDCVVSIPAAKHVPGVVERPEWYRKENIVYDITLRGLIPLSAEAMHDRIAQMAAAAQPDSDTFVFIHGFNVSFNEAVMRTAQIAYDFKFVGAPILFSWPSSGKETLTGYTHDAERSQIAEDSLYQFLNDIVLKAGSKKIHLVAHSMGNRVLLGALKRFSNEGRGELFGEVILAAPDVLQDRFSAAGPKKIAALAHRLTLYASSKDLALRLSEKFNGGLRLGESGDKMFLAEGIDTVDVSDVKNGSTDGLGHSPFSSAEPVMMDLARLLLKGIAPNIDPRNLRSIPLGNQSYWTFKE